MIVIQPVDVGVAIHLHPLRLQRILPQGAVSTNEVQEVEDSGAVVKDHGVVKDPAVAVVVDVEAEVQLELAVEVLVPPQAPSGKDIVALLSTKDPLQHQHLHQHQLQHPQIHETNQHPITDHPTGT